MAAFELLVDATGLFEIDTRARPRAGLLRPPTEAVEKWLVEQHARSALLEPVLMPMVVRPRRWKNIRAGGYLRPLPGRGLVKTRDRGLPELLADADLALVYEAVNHIQETPWRINRRVLDVMREAWDGGGSARRRSRPEDDLPPPASRTTSTPTSRRRKWKRQAPTVHEQNAQLFSQRLAVQQRLWVAEKFADEPAIWFPHALDFRGRVYPIPARGSTRSPTTGKALLEFAHGLPLGKSGAYWLAVHIANLFGIDKVSFADRVKWTYDHAAQLIDSA
jgi:DNA-directed RNA polymerase